MKALPCWISGFFVFKKMITQSVYLFSSDGRSRLQITFFNSAPFIQVCIEREDKSGLFKIKESVEIDKKYIDDLNEFLMLISK
jgi:hypothetical protein